MTDARGTAVANDAGVGSRPLRVLLVDDQKIMLTALKTYLGDAEDLQVVGEATDGRAAIVQARGLRPDVVLMDLQMPGMDGVEATAQIVRDNSAVAVVAVTTFQTEEYVIPALRAGASGYLLKSEEPEVIIEAVRAAARGESVVSREITRLLIRSVERTPEKVADDDVLARAATLSARERDVLAALCQGRSNREIGRVLDLSETTVKTHISSIMLKLDVRDRVQIVVTALTNGLVPSSVQ